MTKLGSICRNNSIALDVVRAIFVQRTGEKDKVSLDVSQNETSKESYNVKDFDEFLEDYNKKIKRNDVCDEVLSKVEFLVGDSSLSLLISCLPDAMDKESLVILSPKVEYQPEFGEEQMTQYELIREWIHLKFMKNTQVKRIRMRYSTYTILSVKDLTLNMVKAELNRLYQIKEEDLLSSLFQLLSMLKDFPPAIYLARHDPAKKERILIYQHHYQKSVASTNAHLNLETLYADMNFNANCLDELQWTPIDVEGVTDIHLQSKVAPGLFPFYGKNFRKQIKDFKRVSKPVTQKLFGKQKNGLMGKKKNKKRKANRNKKQMLKKASNDVSESFDPEQLFDASGNINIMNFSCEPKPSCSKSFQESVKESPVKGIQDETQDQKITVSLKKVDEKESPGANKRIVLRNREIKIPEEK